MINLVQGFKSWINFTRCTHCINKFKVLFFGVISGLTKCYRNHRYNIKQLMFTNCSFIIEVGKDVYTKEATNYR